MLDALEHDTSIRNVCFLRRAWTPKMLKILYSCLINNNTIRSVTCMSTTVLPTIARAIQQNTKIQEITLRFQYLNYKPQTNDIKEFCSGLNTSRGVRRLVLDEADISAHEWILLCESLQINKSITYLEINHESGLQLTYLEQALRTNEQVSSLAIVACQLSQSDMDALAAIIAHGRLKALTVSRTNISALPTIAESLKQNTSITKLDLSNSRIKMQLIGEVLKVNSTLTSLNLSDCGVLEEDSHYFQLDQNTSLRHLSLASNRLTGTKICQDLINNTTLTSLDLNYQSIMLNGSALNQLIAKNEGITSLNVKTISQFSNEHFVRDISDGVLFNSTLRRLAIRTASALTVITLCSALRSNTSITCLDLGVQNHSLPTSQLTSLQLENELVQLLHANQSITKIAYIEFPMVSKTLKSNKERQKEAIRRTLLIIAMITSKPAAFILPLEIWANVFGHLKIPGVSRDLGSVFLQRLKESH